MASVDRLNTFFIHAAGAECKDITVTVTGMSFPFQIIKFHCSPEFLSSEIFSLSINNTNLCDNYKISKRRVLIYGNKIIIFSF